MTPAVSTLALATALGLTALTFDAEPLWVPALALAALAGGAALWVGLGARGLRVRRRLDARSVVEEEPLRVTLQVRSGRVPLPTGTLVDPLLEEPAPLPAGRRSARLRIDVRFGRRGRRRLPPSQVVVADPLGLATRTVDGVPSEVDDEVLVLPRIEPVTAGADGGERDHQTRGRPAMAAEVDLDGVRQLREGTPASRIFWPSLARGGEPMERRLTADADSRPLVVLDPRGAVRPEDLDAAVRAAASLTLHLARAGGCALLLPGDRRPAGLDPTLAGWPHLHARLALVEDGGRPNLAGATARRSAVLYVSAQVRARPPRALAHAPAGGRVLVVPGELAGRRAAFAVAGCRGYDLAPRSARRTAA